MDEFYKNFIENKFVINPGEVEFLLETGETITGDLKEYFEKRKLNNITFFEKLSIGDIVKLKRTGKIVVVTECDYIKNEVIKSDYIGYLYNSDNKDLILFSQEDIEKKYSINIEEINKKKIK